MRTLKWYYWKGRWSLDVCYADGSGEFTGYSIGETLAGRYRVYRRNIGIAIALPVELDTLKEAKKYCEVMFLMGVEP